MIIIDTAEKSLGKRVAVYLKKNAHPYRWENIATNTEEGGYEKIGDYTNDRNSFLVEAKFDDDESEGNDLYTSIITQRVHTQCEKGTRNHPNFFFAIIGYLSEMCIEHPNQAGLIMSTRAKLECQWGANVKVFEDAEQFADWLKWMDRYSGTTPQRVMERKKLTVPTPQKMLMQVTGIREKLSAQLLKIFKTLNGVMNASINALMNVEGVGKKKAEAIHKACLEIFTDEKR